MPKHRASTPLETARLQDKAEYVREVSALTLAAMCKPEWSERQIGRAASVAIEAAVVS